MKPKTAKSKTQDENEERFYRFAKALIAVPKKELDKESAKHDAPKTQAKRQSKSRSVQ
jgi:hypothetical protein